MFTPPETDSTKETDSSKLTKTAVQPGPYPFALAANEVVKKIYPMVHVRGILGKMSGVLFVTDARIIYRADSRNLFGESTLHSEIQMSDVAGLSLNRKRAPGIEAALFVFVAVPWIFFWFFMSWAWSANQPDFVQSIFRVEPGLEDSGTNEFAIVAWVSVVLSIVILRGLVYETRGFTINSRQQGAAAIQIGPGQDEPLARIVQIFVAPTLGILSRFGAVDAAGSLASGYVDDDVLHEIGALILDLQARGVLGGSEDLAMGEA